MMMFQYTNIPKYSADVRQIGAFNSSDFGIVLMEAFQTIPSDWVYYKNRC